MASGSNPLGELSVLVSGDITALEEALNQIPSLAQSVASQVDQSFAGLSSNAGGVGDAATAAAVGVQDLSSAAASADASIGALSDSMAGAASEAQGVATETGNIAPELVSVGEESDSATEKITEFLETGLELAGVTLTLEAIKEALVDCVESFAEFQRAGEALTSITGNADAAAEAMERIPPIANQLAQSIPDLENFQQQLARFGVSLEAIPGAMQAASDASREAGVSFDTAASSLERIANSGAINIRTLQNTGITLQQLGDAMGMSGASATALSTALKALGTDSEAVEARWSILESATQSFAGVSQKTADDVTGSWQQLQNAVHEATVKIGADIASLAGSGGVQALTSVIDTIGTAVVGIVGLFSELASVIGGVVKISVDALVSVIGAAALAAQGNWKAAVEAIQVGGQQIASDTQATLADMTSTFQSTGSTIVSLWGNVATSTAASNDTITSSFAKVQNVALLQEQAFQRVATAYANGKASADEYTLALNALNKAQVAANNGLQQAPTVLLLVENAYRELGVAAANALTNLQQTAAAVDAGSASWTQYVAALNAFSKAQEAVNGGLQTLNTATALQDVAFQQVLIDLKNAETQFAAVSNMMVIGQATTQEYTAALQALNKEQIAFNNGVQQFQTAVLLAVDAQQGLRTAALNAQTALQAQLLVYQQTAQGLPQLIALTNDYVKAQEAASNGAISWASANLQLAAQESQLELAASNANTVLAQATQKLADGTIGYGVYLKALQAAQSAEEALTGVHKTTAAATQTLTTATQGVADTFKVATGAILTQQDALNQISQNYKQLQINLQNAQTWLAAVQQGYQNNQVSAQTLVGALQGVVKAQEALGAASGTTTGAMAMQINTLENLVSTTAPASTALQTVGVAALNAASNMQSAAVSINAAINSIAGDAFQATQVLDAFFNSIDQGAANGGSISGQVNPGGQISQIINGVVTTVNPAGLPGATQPAAAVATAATVANTVATTANTVATATVTTATNALLEQIINQISSDTPDQLLQAMGLLSDDLSSGTITTAELQGQMGALMAAVNAATASGSSASGLLQDALSGLMDAVNGQTTATTAAAVATTAATATLSSNVTTAADAINSAVTTAALVIASVPAIIGAVLGTSGANSTSLLSLLPPGLNVTPNIPGIGTSGASSLLSTQPAGYYSPYVGGQQPPLGLTVNVTGNTITSAAAAQALANTIMQTAINKLRTVAGLKINV